MKALWQTLAALAAAAALFAVATRLRPVPPRTGADLVPADAPIFLSIPDGSSTGQRWAQSPASSLTAALKLQRTARATTGFLPRSWSELFAAATNGAAQLSNGEVFVAVLGLQTAPAILPEAVVGIRTGPPTEQTTQWLENLRRQLQRTFPTATFGGDRYFKTNYQLWRLQPGVELCIARLNDYLVLSLGARPLMEIIDCWRSPARGSLAASAVFAELTAHLPRRYDTLLIAQSAPLAEKLKPFINWLPQLQLLAEPFAGSTALGATQTFEPDGVHETLIVSRADDATAPRRTTAPVAIAARLPPSCAAALCAAAEPTELYGFIARQGAGLGQRDWAKLQALFETGWSSIGIDFQKDLLGMLQSPCIVALDWPDGLQSPDALFGAAVKDAARLHETLQRTNAPPNRWPLRWRLIDGWLWLAPTEAALDRVANTASGTSCSLDGNPEWRRALPTLPSGAWGWCFASSARLSAGNDPGALAGNVTRRGGHDVCTIQSSFGAAMTAWLMLDHAAPAHARK